MENLERTFSPTEAAAEINFAPSLLRRYAAAYEAQGGYIAKDKRGGRIYPASLLEHFSATRERVRGGELLEDALRTLDLAPTKPATDEFPEYDAKQLLGLFEERLTADRQKMLRLIDERLQAQRQAFTAGLERIESKLANPAQAQAATQREIAALREELGERLAAAKPKAVTVLTVSPRQVELERQNRTLETEIEQLRLKAQGAEKRRPWWRLWGRG